MIASRTGRKLLICLVLLCMVATLFGVVVISYAEAQQQYVLQDYSHFGQAVGISPVVVAIHKNGVYYALTGGADTAQSTPISVQNDVITSNVTSNMLWTVTNQGGIVLQNANCSYLCIDYNALVMSESAFPFALGTMQLDNKEGVYATYNGNNFATTTNAENATTFVVFALQDVSTEPQPTQTHTLTFVVDGQEDQTMQLPIDQPTGDVDISSIEAVASSGYVFCGWKAENDESLYTNTFYWTQSATPQNIILTAQFVKSVVVQCDANFDGGQVVRIDALEGESMALPVSSTRVGYVFEGWWLDVNSNGQAEQDEVHRAGESFVVTQDATFKALWRYDGFVITFTVDGKLYAEKLIAQSDGADFLYYFAEQGVTAPSGNWIPQGKVFDGWQTQSKYNDTHSYILVEGDDYSSGHLVLPAQSQGVEYEVLYYQIEVTARLVDAPIVCAFVFNDQSGNQITCVEGSVNSQNSTFEITLGNDHAGQIPEGMMPVFTEEGNRFELGERVAVCLGDTFHTRTFVVTYAKSVVVSFDFDGGKHSDNADCNFYENTYFVRSAGSTFSIDTPYLPTKTDHTFVGWQCGDLVVKGNQAFTVDKQDMLFVALWDYVGCTVTFRNGQQEQYFNLPFDKLTFEILVDNPTPPEGKWFVGWQRTDNGVVYRREDILSIVVGEDNLYQDITLEAVFADIRQVQVTLRYGQSSKTLSIAEGERLGYDTQLFGENFQLELGAEFLGWYADEYFTTPFTALNYLVDYNCQDFTLYAKVAEAVTFTFHFEGQTHQLYGNEVSLVYVLYQGDGVFPADAKSNYDLVGWAIVEGGEVVYDAKANVKITNANHLNLYAVWERNCFDVTFVAGEAREAVLVKKSNATFTIADILTGEKATQFEKPHKTLVWQDTDGNAVSVYQLLINDKNQTFEATYQDIQYSISFEVNGGSQVQNIVATVDTSITLPTTQKRGSEFLGWVDGDGNAVELSKMPGESLSLFAKWKQIDYTVTFDVNGGSAVDTITGHYGENINAPANPIKEGYTFAGWFDGDELFVFDKMPDANVTLYASWLINKYTITFVCNGGSEVASITQEFATELTSPQNPTKDGFRFVKWQDADGYDFEFVTMPAKDVILYALWAEKDYTVTFEANNGSANVNLFYDQGEQISQPQEPTKVGYTFGGWYLDGNLFEFSAMPAHDLTLVAKWTVNKYTVSFETDGGSDTPSITANFGAEVTEPTVPTKEGYTFIGWYLDQTAYEFFTMPAENITLVAKWQVNTYTITFLLGNGQEDVLVTCDFGATVQQIDTPTKEGYSFGGWLCDGESYILSTMPASNLTLTAHWEPLSFTVTFVLDNGDDDVTKTFTYGESITVVQAEKVGHTFIGWYIDEIECQLGAMPAQDLTVVAKWSINSYTITFDCDGGSEVDSVTQNYGAQVFAPTPPTKVGYTFIKWQDDRGKDFVFGTMPDGDVTLKSVWQVNEYVLTFSLQNGAEDIQATYAFGGQIAPIDNPIKQGYAFQGWYLEDTLYIFGAMPANDLTLTAHWSVNQYTVTFDTNGGSKVDSVTQNYGTVLILNEIPAKAGYTFVKWVDEEGNDCELATMPAQNVTLYALWQANRYAVYFDGNGGINCQSVTVTFGSSETLPIPTRNGYLFAGWYLGDVKFDFSAMPAEDFTLVAHWQIDSQLFDQALLNLQSAITLEQRFLALKNCQRVLDLWTDEEIATLQRYADYLAIKQNFDSLSQNAVADVNVAHQVATSCVATLTPLAIATALVYLLKRRY